MNAEPYTSAQVARRLGLTPKSFRRSYQKLVAAGMPASLVPHGQGSGRRGCVMKFERGGMDAWLARFHPLAPRAAAANDTAAPHAETAWREHLANVYGGVR